jgi:hypothetical protein
VTDSPSRYVSSTNSVSPGKLAPRWARPERQPDRLRADASPRIALRATPCPSPSSPIRAGSRPQRRPANRIPGGSGRPGSSVVATVDGGRTIGTYRHSCAWLEIRGFMNTQVTGSQRAPGSRAQPCLRTGRRPPRPVRRRTQTVAEPSGRSGTSDRVAARSGPPARMQAGEPTRSSAQKHVQ